MKAEMFKHFIENAEDEQSWEYICLDLFARLIGEVYKELPRDHGFTGLDVFLALRNAMVVAVKQIDIDLKDIRLKIPHKGVH